MVYNERFFAAITLRQFLKDGGERWNDARHDDVVDISQPVALVPCQVTQQHGVFIGCALTNG